MNTDTTNPPVYLTIKGAQLRWGLSRSRTYRLLATGHLTARKLKGRTLVEAKAGDEYFGTLPKAMFRSRA